jgi:hypothetical protein
MESNFEGAWCRHKDKDRNILKTRGVMWIGFSLTKAGTIVGLRGVLSNTTEDSTLLLLHGMSAGKLAAMFW